MPETIWGWGRGRRWGGKEMCEGKPPDNFWGQQMDWDFILISGFKPPQFVRMVALGHICIWSVSYTTQGAHIPWGWELYKYLIGKISSMYAKLIKLLWNNYFPESMKIQVSEDMNNSTGTHGLMNTLSPHKTTQTLLREKYKNMMPAW